jgi:hypothetical protein
MRRLFIYPVAGLYSKEISLPLGTFRGESHMQEQAVGHFKGCYLVPLIVEVDFADTGTFTVHLRKTLYELYHQYHIRKIFQW